MGLRVLAALAALALFLAGAYLDPVYTLVAWLVAGLPLASLALLVLQVQLLRYSQDFQTRHPCKGEEFSYEAHVRNTSPLALYHCRLHFVLGLEGIAGGLEDRTVALGPRERQTLQFRIACPFRGLYRVGLESIAITDSLGLWTWNIRLEPVTFYVYPRIQPVELPAGFNAADSLRHVGSETGQDLDPARMRGIREYRPGESLRLLLHRRFLETGQAWVREPEAANPPGLRLCLDLRRDQPLDKQVLELEDRMFGLAFCLLHQACRAGVPVEVVSWIRHWQVDRLDGPADFTALLARSMQLLYGPQPGMEHWLADAQNGWLAAPGMSTIVLTDRWQGSWLDFLAGGDRDLAVWLWDGLLDEAGRSSVREEALRYPGGLVLIRDEPGGRP